MELFGHDGNIFAILGRASRLLRENGQRDQSKEMCERVYGCHSYDDALFIISEYVETELSDPDIWLHGKNTKTKERGDAR